MVEQAPVAEVPETDNVVAEVERETTWREALSAWLCPAEDRLSDEDIFTILNVGRDDAAVAELWAARGVTLPMYCVWKSKYRQLDLEQMRTARRREQRRRYTVIGAVALTATLLVTGIGIGIVRAVASTFNGVIATSAAAKSEPERAPVPSAAPVEPRPIVKQPSKSATAIKRSPANAVAPTAETGYRIQVTAAETDGEGRAIVAQLTSKGYPAYMTPATVGNKDVFRVRVGPFDTLPAAEEVAVQLRSDGYGGAWIAR